MSVLPQLRVPRENGAVLAKPPLDAVGPLLNRNRQQFNGWRLESGLRFRWELQRRARQEALSAAREYLQKAGEPVPGFDGASILMAGHQPELFHPGVWAKNFALNRLAREHGAVPVNLVVDNDSVKSPALNVPAFHNPPPPLADYQPRVLTVPFDRWTAETPYEERRVIDEQMFASFPERVPKNWGFVPILEDFWITVRQQEQRTSLLGERLASARRAWERRWGCHNLELPVSCVCQTESFAWFAYQLLAELPFFHSCYNECVHNYRTEHGIRSRNHPVPDLVAEGDWLETPFWAWRTGQTRRGRLMARGVTDRIELRVDDEDWPSLPLNREHTVHGSPLSVIAWQDLERRGFKVRSRALTNTLYARLFLADLFIHGIGGAKYDELTDVLMQRFFGVEPPAFLVLSATLLLPFPRYPSRSDDCRNLARELRDLHWNPQRHVNLESAAAKLAHHKQAWINQQPSDRQARRERFGVLRELTDNLRQYADGQAERLRRELTMCEQQVRANDVLQRRDYAFCLYPEQTLKDFCTRFL